MGEVAGASGAAGVRLRTRIWSVLLSLFVPGLGQAFLGRYWRGVAFTAAVVIAAVILRASVFLWPAWPPAAVLPAILIGFIAGVVTMLWAAVDSWRCGRWPAVPRPAWPKRYLAYLVIVLAWYVPNAITLIAPSWRAFSTPSASMVPTLQPGDYLLVLDGYFRTHEPQRGDLVAFKLPCEYPLLDRATAEGFAARCDRSVDFIKRIVGLPGDRVQLKHGVVFVNEIALPREAAGSFVYVDPFDGKPQSYRQEIERTPDGARYSVIQTVRGDRYLDDTEALTVPAGRYFVLGDSRDNSADSRDPTSGVGYVPRDRLVGKAAFIYLSIDRSRGPNASSFLGIRWERIGMPLS